MPAIGIDIGSTAAKAAVLEDGELQCALACPTGFSSFDAAERVAGLLRAEGFEPEAAPCVATGYGRVAVPFAGKVVTEITCHGRGAAFLFGSEGTVVDVGGQDTKVIVLRGGKVAKFAMNDKCSAGTGKFLEVMANRLGVSQEELARLARTGAPTSISSMCTVFAESEVIGLIGAGTPREDIAYGVIDSVVEKVSVLARQGKGAPYFLTGGLCENGYFVERLGARLGAAVSTGPEARFAGAIGAALIAAEGEGRRDG